MHGRNEHAAKQRPARKGVKQRTMAQTSSKTSTVRAVSGVSPHKPAAENIVATMENGSAAQGKKGCVRRGAAKSGSHSHNRNKLVKQVGTSALLQIWRPGVSVSSSWYLGRSGAIGYLVNGG